jgi:hypothetical protein
MATKNTAVRDAQVTNLSGLFNRLDIRTSGGATVLVTFTVTWGAASTGVINIGSTLSASASDTGTAAEARLYHNTNTEEISGITVSTSGAQINLDNTSITSGQNVQITSLTLTEPAATA